MPPDPQSERVWNAERTTHAPDRLKLAALMRRQAGAVSLEQLIELGCARGVVRRMVMSGDLLRLHQGVCADARAPLTPRAHLWAAQLALGPTSFLSHRTSTALLGLRVINIHAIEVTVTTGHTPRIKGLKVHRTTCPPTRAELRTTGGLRHSSYTRALIELAPIETASELDRLIAEGGRKRLLSLDALDAALRRRTHVRGRKQLERALERYRPTPKDVSTLERDFAAWLTTLRDIPPPQRNVHLGDRWEVDFYWPAHRLVVETDGDRYHGLPADMERDRLKDAWLQRRGIRVIRITGFRFAHDRAGIHDDLRGLIAAAA